MLATALLRVYYSHIDTGARLGSLAIQMAMIQIHLFHTNYGHPLKEYHGHLKQGE